MPARKSNLWPFSKRKSAPAAKSAHRSSMTVGEATRAAFKAGQQSGDTGAFDGWLRSKGLEGRGNVLRARLAKEYERGVIAGEAPSRKPADDLNRQFIERTSASKAVLYKGRKIEPRGDSWVIPSIDRESEFDTLADAKRFIDSWGKTNPETRESFLNVIREPARAGLDLYDKAGEALAYPSREARYLLGLAKRRGVPKVLNPVTDRAHRYRANNMMPDGPKVCAWCGSKRNVVPDHIDGFPDHTVPSNLQWLCKSCNTKKGAAFARLGKGRLTHQYNPAEGVPTFQQYAWAVAQHSRGAHDEGGAIIHATPVDLRSEYARRIAGVKRERGTDSMLPDWARNPMPEQTLISQAHTAHSVQELARLHKYALVKRLDALKAAVDARAAQLNIRHETLLANHPRQWANPATTDPRDLYVFQFMDGTWRVATVTGAKGYVPDELDGAYSTERAAREAVRAYFGARSAGNPVQYEHLQAAYGAGKATGSDWRGRFTKGAARKEFDNWVAYRKGSFSWLAEASAAELESLWRNFYAGAKWGFDSSPVRGNPAKVWERFASKREAEEQAARYRDAQMPVRVVKVKGGWEVRGVKRNPSDSAAALYESFHGKPSTEEVVIEEEVHEHEHLAVLGRLVEVWIETPTGLLACIEFDQDGEEDPVLVCASEDGRQLYFEGGDQAVDLAALKMDGEEWVKDRMVLGQFARPTCKCGGEFLKVAAPWYQCQKCGRKVHPDSKNRDDKDRFHNIAYHTRKDFDKFEPIDYQHDLGEETGVRPFLEFDPRNKKLYVSGGQYFIEQPLLATSPGIEN